MQGVSGGCYNFLVAFAAAGIRTIKGRVGIHSGMGCGFINGRRISPMTLCAGYLPMFSLKKCL